MRQKYMPKPQKSKMSKAKKLKMTKRAVLTAIAIFITILIVFPLILIIPNAFKEKRDLFVLGEMPPFAKTSAICARSIAVTFMEQALK